MTDGIWFVVKTPSDIEDDQRDQLRLKLKNQLIKTLIQQAKKEATNPYCDAKRIEKLLGYALEVMEKE